jgi:hypothetical protein
MTHVVMSTILYLFLCYQQAVSVLPHSLSLNTVQQSHPCVLQDKMN